MWGIVVLVLFVMVMFLWLLGLLGGDNAIAVKSSPWLAWFACLFLGIVVFLTGFGYVTLPR